MKTRIAFRFLGVLAVSSLSLISHGRATTVGLTPNTSGSYGIWDTFPAGTNTFTGRTPDNSGAITAPLLSVTSGGLVTGANDRLYLAGAPSNWTATGTTSFAVKSFELELKNYMYTSQSLLAFFTVSLTVGGNTYAPNSTLTTIVPEAGNNDEIVKWTWSAALAANTGTSYSVNFASTTGAQLSIDGFDIVARPTAVPEPSSMVGAAFGCLAMFGAVRRFRHRTQA